MEFKSIYHAGCKKQVTVICPLKTFCDSGHGQVLSMVEQQPSPTETNCSPLCTVQWLIRHQAALHRSAETRNV